MPLSTAESHPVYVRAREAARARPEFRVSRPPAPVTRLSNGPVRLPGSQPLSIAVLELSAHAIALGAPDDAPGEVPPPSPPEVDPVQPEITDLPPSTVPLPTHQPPGMTPPIA